MLSTRSGTTNHRHALLHFEPHRWCSYETGRASQLKEKTVEGFRKPRGGRCWGRYPQVDRTSTGEVARGARTSREARFLPEKSPLRRRSLTGRCEAKAQRPRHSQTGIRCGSYVSEVQPKADRQAGERSPARGLYGNPQGSDATRNRIKDEEGWRNQ